MKKLFFAAMALAAIVSCSKEEVDTVLSTSQKSVTISIANLAQPSRVDGGQTVAGKAEACVTDLNNLKFLFADANGEILEVKTITDGAPANEDFDYTFHQLDERVMMMGVAANSTNAVVGKTLEDVYNEWMTETPAIEYTAITVYSTNASEDGFNDQYGIDLQENGTCQLDGHEWPLYKASVRVAPAHARVEIHAIGCTDLGQNDYGYSKITLNDLTLASKYTQTLGQVLTPEANTASLEGKVWSWNILPQETSNMVLDITVEGKNYNVAVPDKTVTVEKYKKSETEYINKFEAENIYVINLKFKEENIDLVESYVCVDVDVEVAKWVIVPTDVEFATGN